MEPRWGVAAVRIEAMDVEKTMQFLLEQQAVFASRMDELAINLVAIGKAQVRFGQQQARIQELQIGHEERIRHLARFSHRLTVEARDKPAITSLRLLAVFNRLCRGDVGPEADAARQEARATSRLAVR